MYRLKSDRKENDNSSSLRSKQSKDTCTGLAELEDCVSCRENRNEFYSEVINTVLRGFGFFVAISCRSMLTLNVEYFWYDVFQYWIA